MTLLGVSETILLVIVNGVFTLIGTVFAGLITYFLAKLNQKATVGEVMARNTYTLVNSGYSAQLKISALALRRVADLLKNPDDILAAEAAEKLLIEHEQKQSVIDQGGRTIPGVLADAHHKQPGKTKPAPRAPASS